MATGRTALSRHVGRIATHGSSITELGEVGSPADHSLSANARERCASSGGSSISKSCPSRFMCIRTASRPASQSVWGDHRTAITVVSTAGHARPGALVEIDAVAVVPDRLPGAPGLE
ncbi:hypothetical protein GCM10027068_40720 [Prescottella soli]